MDKYLNANIIFSKFSRDYVELKKDLPIRPSEMGVLNIITKREGLFTPVMIAELLGVSKPMIASHISALEEKGYIMRESSSNDKRSVYILSTEKAKELVNKSENNLNRYLKKIENKLGEKNFELLIKLMDAAREILEEDRNL